MTSLTDLPAWQQLQQHYHQIKDEHMRHLWKVMVKGARTSVREKMCMFIRR